MLHRIHSILSESLNVDLGNLALIYAALKKYHTIIRYGRLYHSIIWSRFQTKSSQPFIIIIMIIPHPRI